MKSFSFKSIVILVFLLSQSGWAATACRPASNTAEYSEAVVERYIELTGTISRLEGEIESIEAATLALKTARGLFGRVPGTAEERGLIGAAIDYVQQSDRQIYYTQLGELKLACQSLYHLIRQNCISDVPAEFRPAALVQKVLAINKKLPWEQK